MRDMLLQSGWLRLVVEDAFEAYPASFGQRTRGEGWAAGVSVRGAKWAHKQ